MARFTVLKTSWGCSKFGVTPGGGARPPLESDMMTVYGVVLVVQQLSTMWPTMWPAQTVRRASEEQGAFLMWLLLRIHRNSACEQKGNIPSLHFDRRRISGPRRWLPQNRGFVSRDGPLFVNLLPKRPRALTLELCLLRLLGRLV